MGSPIGSIAQLGERMPYKHDVTGSSPVVPTIAQQAAALFSFYLFINTKRAFWGQDEYDTVYIENPLSFDNSFIKLRLENCQILLLFARNSTKNAAFGGVCC